MSSHTPQRNPLTREQRRALVTSLWPSQVIEHLPAAALASLAEAHLGESPLGAPQHSMYLCHLERCQACNERLFALIELLTAEFETDLLTLPAPDLSFLQTQPVAGRPDVVALPPKLDLAVRLLERAAVLAQRSTVAAGQRLEAILARRLEQSRDKEQQLGARLDRMDALQEELEARVTQLIEWTRAALSEGLSQRIWAMEWLPSSLRGSLIDFALALASLTRAIRQPIQEMLLEARLNRVKMRRTVLERDLAQTRAQQVALEIRLEEMRASAAAGSPLAQPLEGSSRR